MRTTLNIDDDVLKAAKEYAERRSVGLGKAVSDLVRRGMASRRLTRMVNGVHVVDLPADSPRVTTKMIGQLDADH